MKTVLHVLRTFENGGTERYLINLLKKTYQEYNNIILVYDKVNYWNKELKEMNVKVISINNPKKDGVIKNLKMIGKIIKENKIDVLYSYTHYNSGIVMLAGFLKKVKIRITHSHRSSSEQKHSIKYHIYRLSMKLLINIFSTDRLACGNEAGKDLFYKKFKNVNNGIEIDKYIYDENLRKKIRKEFNIPENYKVIGTMGRLDKNKNQLFLIKVFKKYHDINNNSKLIIIGEGDNRKELEKYISNNELSTSVILTGIRSDANEIYNAMDLFALTSIKEGLPYVLIEAQTNGLSCVVSDSVDKNSNISNHISFLSLDEDYENWVDCIIENIKKRNDNIEKIISNGYSLNDSVTIIKNIYDR